MLTQYGWEWRNFLNEELQSFCHSSNVIRLTKSRILWIGHVARTEDTSSRRAFNILTDKSTGKRVLRRSMDTQNNILHSVKHN